MTPAEHYSWADYYAGEVDALPRPWDTASRERASALAAAGRLHLQLAEQAHMAEPPPLCRDEYHPQPGVTVYCAKVAGHEPGLLDGGHRSLAGEEFW